MPYFFTNVEHDALMPDLPDKPEAPDTIACSICRKEVPLSEAFTTEAEDYVLYFCGIECFDQWHKEAEQGLAKDRSDKQPQ